MLGTSKNGCFYNRKSSRRPFNKPRTNKLARLFCGLSFLELIAPVQDQLLAKAKIQPDAALKDLIAKFVPWLNPVLTRVVGYRQFVDLDPEEQSDPMFLNQVMAQTRTDAHRLGVLGDATRSLLNSKPGRKVFAFVTSINVFLIVDAFSEERG
jgi:hypothetical protein